MDTIGAFNESSNLNKSVALLRTHSDNVSMTATIATTTSERDGDFDHMRGARKKSNEVFHLGRKRKQHNRNDMLLPSEGGDDEESTKEEDDLVTLTEGKERKSSLLYVCVLF